MKDDLPLSGDKTLALLRILPEAILKYAIGGGLGSC